VQAAPTAAPVEASPPPPAPVPASPAPPAAADGATSPSDGELRTVPSTPAHRVFIDGRLAGHTGATFTLRCGSHGVRIGGGGKLQVVTVPCGGAAEVASR
jgi:hypothetical protein